MPAYFEELAWAAGFFDGEGTTCICQGPRPRDYPELRVQVGQNGDYCLLRFQQAVDAGVIYDVTTEGKYHWVARNKEGVGVIERLFPYLSLPKREQAQVALQKYNESLARRRPWGDSPRSCWVPTNEEVG